MQQEMIVLDYLSVLEFSGHDAGQFLQGQLTADLKEIGPDSARFAACCNPAGRVLATMLVTGSSDHFYAVCATELAETLRTWLTRFVLRAKVSITPRDDLRVCGLEQTDVPPNEAVIFNSPLGRYAALPRASLKGDEVNDGENQSWRKRETLAGAAWLNTATSAQFLPQMLGMEAIGALSFRKGCYPGQEVIARTHYLGKLKRRPLLCLLEGSVPIEPMSEVELVGDSDAKAVVVDGIAAGADATLLMLVVRADETFRPQAMHCDGEAHAVRWSGAPAPDQSLP